MMDKRPGGVGRVTHSRMHRHVLSHSIADKTLDQVTEKVMRAWTESLPSDLTAATIGRIRNDFMAALARGEKVHRAHLPNGWIANLRDAARDVVNEWHDDDEEAPRAFMPEENIRSVLQAAWEIDSGFAALLAVQVQTGMRFSQTVRCTVGDLVDGRLRIPGSRKGNHSFIPRVLPRALYATLVGVAQGRGRGDLLFTTTEHGVAVEWTHNTFQPLWRDALRKAGVPHHRATCLRDASILRSLKAGLNILHVAKMHDTSAGIISKHYGSHVTDALVAAEEAALVDLGVGLRVVA